MFYRTPSRHVSAASRHHQAFPNEKISACVITTIKAVRLIHADMIFGLGTPDDGWIQVKHVVKAFCNT
jgi:hypothetical protein